jgi:hypothetical protein
MKLYATTTSERASKGQGGNEWLSIEIKIDERGSVKLRLSLNKNSDDSTSIALFDLTQGTESYKPVWGKEIKGKQKKDECTHDKNSLCVRCAEIPLI